MNKLFFMTALTLFLANIGFAADPAFSRLHVSEINTEIYEKHRIFGLDRLKFLRESDVYVTEIKFAEGYRIILSLTSDESDVVENENDTALARTKKNMILDLSHCVKPGRPLSHTCKYEDLRYVTN